MEKFGSFELRKSSDLSMNEEIKILLVNESDYSLGRTVFLPIYLLNHFV